MSTNDHQCGSLARLPLATVVDRAVHFILDYQSPRAICVDPVSRVSVEFPDTCCEFDLVGVYDPALGILELSRRIAEDLEFEAWQRGLGTMRRAA